MAVTTTAAREEVSMHGTDQQHWDERYRERERMWTGDPNGALVDEVGHLSPGRALDVGCGEGADAVWLARRGWRVTAVDLSEVALERARAAVGDLGDGEIEWRHADLLTNPPAPGAYDLVSALYFPIPRQLGPTPVRGLIEAVAPGGTLLFVHHEFTEDNAHNHDGPDPREYHTPGEVAELLDDDWHVEVLQTRERSGAAAEHTGHRHDIVLRARRSTR